MQNSLCIRTFLTTTIAEMPSGSLGIVVASPDLSGRGNLREAGRSWATGLPYQGSLRGREFSLRLMEMGKVRVSAVRHDLNQR
ncbi:MAG: hypothetical protein J7L92_06225 [Dehalococcoidia bacterium]|nr:hypothetical protein [Dehalococcoidia bacterium]